MTFEYYLTNYVGTLTDIWGDKIIYQDNLWKFVRTHTGRTISSFSTQTILNVIPSQDLERLKAEYDLYRILNG